MKRYRRLLVPLALNDADGPAITWACEVARLAGSEEAVFLHAAEVREIPEAAKQKYPWLLEPLEATLTKRLEETVAAQWEGPDETKLFFSVRQGTSPSTEVLKAALEYESDLVIVARESFGANLAVRLARKAPCSVMTVPEGESEGLSSVVVPNDFSEYSKAALDVALAFAEAKGLDGIDSVHVYHVGDYAHRATLPQSELEAMERAHAQQRHAAMVADCDDRGLRVRRHEIHHRSVTGGLYAFVHEHGSSLIVTGSRGRNTMTAMLLGSNAEELLRTARVPVIAAKIKGTGQKLLEALLAA